MDASERTRIRQAATVVLARDTADGMEIFMLLRSSGSVFAPDCYVFPGGALEGRDRQKDIASFCEGLGDEEASARIGIESGGLAYWHAAIRECFEEAGLLLAVNMEGALFSATDTETKRRFASYRKEVYEGKTELHHICSKEGLRLAIGDIEYLSHWITPEGSPQRFDTRFFIARVPPEQEAHHDEEETVAHIWVRPEEALRRNKDGRFKLMRPTIATLKAISGIATSSDLMATVQGWRRLSGEAV